MYQAYWGLKQTPFVCLAGSGPTAPSPVHAEALARLAFLVENGGRLGLLLGAAGSGKSSLLAQFVLGQRKQGTASALISGTGSLPGDVLLELARQWGCNPEPSESTGQLWQRVADRLAELQLEAAPALIALDDADAASSDVHLLLLRLLSLPDMRLTIIAAAHPESLHRLDGRLTEQAGLRIDLGQWNEQETRDYVALSLREAGRLQPAFADQAVRRLFELSGGVPRKVNQLAQLALVAGAGQNLIQIDDETILSVFDELSTSFH
jgi:type II secretory pathway predicted ATPase ExeA